MKSQPRGPAQVLGCLPSRQWPPRIGMGAKTDATAGDGRVGRRRFGGAALLRRPRQAGKRPRPGEAGRHLDVQRTLPSLWAQPGDVGHAGAPALSLDRPGIRSGDGVVLPSRTVLRPERSPLRAGGPARAWRKRQSVRVCRGTPARSNRSEWNDDEGIQAGRGDRRKWWRWWGGARRYRR